MVDLNALLKAEIGSYDNNEWTGEIGGTEVTLYARPLTPKDVQMVRKKFPDFMEAPEPAAMVNIICSKALDENDNKAFIIGKDGPLLNNIKVSKIGEIFAGLFGDQFDDLDDFGNDGDKLEGVKKNS
jgi:hypothetical protein